MIFSKIRETGCGNWQEYVTIVCRTNLVETRASYEKRLILRDAASRFGHSLISVNRGTLIISIIFVSNELESTVTVFLVHMHQARKKEKGGSESADGILQFRGREVLNFPRKR